MPDKSYTGIQVPDADDPYGFEQILGALADSARVIIPAANATEMAQIATDATAAGFPASAAAPLWCHRTDHDAVYRHNGAGWMMVTGKAGGAPLSVAAGKVDYDMGGATGKSYNVTFPAGRFSTTPVILVGPGPHRALTVTASSSSSSGFTLGVYTVNESASSLSGVARWLALQMTPTTAEG